MDRSPDMRGRRSIRLTGYDYSEEGAYFVTVCAQDRACLFGVASDDGEILLNQAGRMVDAQWLALGDRFAVVELDEFVVMPNHIHGIVCIHDAEPPTPPRSVGAGLVPAQDGDGGATTRVAPTDGDGGGNGPTLGDIVGAFKSLTTVEYGRGVRRLGWPTFRGRLWQRNYFEHIIRNQESLERIRQYIYDNPKRWVLDRENPHAVLPKAEEAWQV